MSIRIFEGEEHANLYAKFRPTVPEHVIGKVLEFLDKKLNKTNWDIAVDVGCGSGQGTNKLSKHFRNCFGFDVSRAQITEAIESKHADNVKYDVAPAESLPTIETNSVQLVTAFTAAHWFDFEKFFAELDRILVVNGVVAIIGYLLTEPINPFNPEDRRMIKVMDDIRIDPRFAPFKNPKITLVDRHYRDIKFPQNYESIFIDDIPNPINACAEDFVGYIESWSRYQGLLEADKQSAEQFSQEMRQKLRDILNTNDLSSKEIIIKYNYFIAMARKLN